MCLKFEKCSEENRVCISITRRKKIIDSRTDNVLPGVDLKQRMKDTSTLKKEFEKILKVKRTSGILVELLFVSLSIALSIMGNKSDYVTIIGIFSTLFVIYNARIINIDQLLFENKAAYLAIDKLFIQLEYSIDDEDEVRNISELYQNALENVENIPDFIFQKKQKKVFSCIKAYVKLLFFVWFEYIIEIFVMFILTLFAI